MLITYYNQAHRKQKQKYDMFARVLDSRTNTLSWLHEANTLISTTCATLSFTTVSSRGKAKFEPQPSQMKNIMFSRSECNLKMPSSIEAPEADVDDAPPNEDELPEDSLSLSASKYNRPL